MIQSLRTTTVCPEMLVYTARLPLDGAVVVELGCGRAEHTRAIAAMYPTARVTAFDVDRIQYDLNRGAAHPPNLRFEIGGAENIEASDESVDIVMMLKSLHHVPGEALNRALREIHRVLRPGGLAYISEPLFAGELNEIVRIFHDEQKVRSDAYTALRRAVTDGMFDLAEEFSFLDPVCYRDFAEFEHSIIDATHSSYRLTAEQYDQVRTRFLAHLGPDGARFDVPMRMDLLRRCRN